MEKARLSEANPDLESQLLSRRKKAKALWANKKEEFIKSNKFKVLLLRKYLALFDQVHDISSEIMAIQRLSTLHIF